jgi:hypothetical protein
MLELGQQTDDGEQHEETKGINDQGKCCGEVVIYSQRRRELSEVHRVAA